MRLLVVAGTAAERDLWRLGAAQASVPLTLLEAPGGPAALQLVHKGGIDIVLLDSTLPDASVLIATARALKPAPFIVMAQPPGTERPRGVDGAVAKPKDVEGARAELERCVRAKVPARVLVIDDSSTMRSIVKKILAGSRYAMEVEEAEEGIAALSQLRNGRFDVVFVDYNMPGLNGFETLKEIKREHPRIAVVMITSTQDTTLADRAQQSGAAAFLKKPFYPADIDAVLERHYGLLAT
ncbi:MAG TPA: response regulator [Pseudolabrys sp.]|nr:response regulator [Pseudolabrys sp.]